MLVFLKILADTFWYLSISAPLLRVFSWFWRIVLLIPLPAWWLWLLNSQKTRDLAGNLQDHFLFEAKLSLALVPLELLSFGAFRWQRDCGPYFFLYLVSGIFLLRASRLVNVPQGKTRFWVESGIFVFLMAAAAVFFSLPPVYGAALSLLGTCYRYLVLPVLIAILRVVIWAVWRISLVFPEISFAGWEKSQELSIGEGLFPWEAETVGREPPGLFRLLGTLVIFMALAFVFWLLYRRLTDIGNRKDRENAGTMERSAADPSGAIRTGNGVSFRRNHVRHYYRKFLALCEKSGIKMGEQLTTENIYFQAKHIWPEADLEEFQRIYREIRYGEYPETDNHKKRAKTLYQTFKEDLNHAHRNEKRTGH